jgi:hypothetical protein
MSQRSPQLQTERQLRIRTVIVAILELQERFGADAMNKPRKTVPQTVLLLEPYLARQCSRSP